MNNIVIEKDLYDLKDLKINFKNYKRYRFILNYSNLQIFNVKSIRKKEIENFIEEEIFSSYDKKEILLDYKKDFRKKETTIYMYRLNEVVKDLVRTNFKNKFIPIELALVKMLKKNKEKIVLFNEKYFSFKIENNILKEIENIKKIEKENVVKFFLEDNKIKEVKNEKI